MEIFETFGIDPIIIGAQIVNFLVILYILKRFLYPTLFKIFKKREELVKESIDKAEKSDKALEKALAKEKEIIKNAQKTATQVLKDAKEHSQAILKEAEESAKKQTQRMISEARTQIELDTKEAESQLNKHVSRLSLELLRKTVSNVFTEEEQDEIIKRAVKEFQKKPN